MKSFLSIVPFSTKFITAKSTKNLKDPIKEDLREHQKAYQKAREILSKNWSSLEGKLILVSGKGVVKKLSE
jgi:hypothetical protein